MDGWLLTSLKHNCLFDPWYIVLLLASSFYIWHWLCCQAKVAKADNCSEASEECHVDVEEILKPITKLHWGIVSTNTRAHTHTNLPVYMFLKPKFSVLFSLCRGLSIDRHSQFILYRKFFKQVSKFSLHHFNCLLNTTSSQPLSNNGCSGMYITASVCLSVV